MWSYYNPVEIIFGENKFKEVHLALKNKSYIIITHPEEIFKKYSDELSSSSNPPLSIITDVQPNPDYKDLLELQNKFASINKTVDYILAIGGGSVTDTAKAIAAFRDKQEYLTDFVRNKMTINAIWNQFIYDKYSKNINIDLDKLKKDILKNENQIEYLLSEIVFDLKENQTLNEKFKIIEGAIKKNGFENHVFFGFRFLSAFL